MRGPLHFLYERLDQGDFDERIANCPAGELPGLRSALKLQVGVFGLMAALTGYSAYQLNPVSPESDNLAAQAAETILTIGLKAPLATVSALAIWTAAEAVAAHRHLSAGQEQ
mgnify:CR=1 FL=1